MGEIRITLDSGFNGHKCYSKLEKIVTLWEGILKTGSKLQLLWRVHGV
jgi:hypothetical protein